GAAYNGGVVRPVRETDTRRDVVFVCADKGATRVTGILRFNNVYITTRHQWAHSAECAIRDNDSAGRQIKCRDEIIRLSPVRMQLIGDSATQCQPRRHLEIVRNEEVVPPAQAVDLGRGISA